MGQATYGLLELLSILMLDIFEVVLVVVVFNEFALSSSKQESEARRSAWPRRGVVEVVSNDLHINFVPS